MFMPSDASPDHSVRSLAGPAEAVQRAVEDRLRDFSTDRRILLLMAMAVVVGCAGAASAWALYHLISLATNIAYYGKFSWALSSIPNHLSPWSILVPVVGCLIIGLMARFGSEKVRGHGIPEAME